MTRGSGAASSPPSRGLALLGPRLRGAALRRGRPERRGSVVAGVRPRPSLSGDHDRRVERRGIGRGSIAGTRSAQDRCGQPHACDPRQHHFRRQRPPRALHRRRARGVAPHHRDRHSPVAPKLQPRLVRGPQGAGRPDLHLHDFRHSGLTWAAATGASVADLMRRGGHANARAALRYQHSARDSDRAIADALAGLAAPVSELAPRDSRGMEAP